MALSGSSTLATRNPKTGRWAGWQEDPALRIQYLEVYRLVVHFNQKIPDVARAFKLKGKSQVYRIIKAVASSGLARS